MSPESTPPFTGFQASESPAIRLPEAFFTTLLPLLADPAQIQLMLYLFWHLEQDPNRVHYVRMMDLTGDPTLVTMLGGISKIGKALQALVGLGAVLQAELPWMDETYYFINAPQGRAAVQAIEAGTWQETGQPRQAVQMTPEKTNIYKLYESNIGPLTPMVADILKADEEEYPPEWIEEAVREAVSRNIRNWKYVQTILKNWQNKGRGNEQNRRDRSQNPEDYRESWLGHD
ncbi:MAG: DnaD domain protein [Anaerolineaceae bacterium]|nr:DnaD domain protein [Anaerolineaceae bacterium]